ncbi:MAG TPA: NAD-dependent epimerase/dehydratase family protein [Nocardioides sp.]|uniref:NAD-dependent epimerase/dehydratase family protein n=1 Tax=Nocardioides sp. TaxID=35761 RepID=UPI002EDB1EEC
MRIAVTGATGNVGWRLVRRLAEEGHEVVGIARRLPDGPGSRVATWRSIDLSLPGAEPDLVAAFDGADAVVHLAWGFQPSHRQDYLTALDLGGTTRVIAAARAAGVGHLVHQSSLGAYSPGPDAGPVDESWPTGGVPSSGYSTRKARAERLLDDLEGADPSLVVTRTRPGIIGQRQAGSSLLRYTVPGIVPGRALMALPVLPLDRRLAFSAVHVDDVTDAFARIISRRIGGAFNLAAPTPVTAEVIAEALGARLVHVPGGLLRLGVAASWRAHLQQVDPGWLDMAMSLPLLDAGRARSVLDWSPSLDGPAVMAEVIDGMVERASAGTPVLRRRTVRETVADAWRRGAVDHRRLP